jgi:periplasmic protein TonB
MVNKENLNPILTFEETILANPSMILSSIPLIGDLNGLRAVLSDGPGKGGGIGDGDGTKVGRGGNGRVPGPGGGDGPPGFGGRFVGNVVQPSIISKPEPEYSEEARKAKHQGSILLQIVVDEHGQPRDIVVTQGLGLGLDERAVEAVKKWKFKPGTQNGKPVPMTAIVQVTFRLL